MRTCIFMMAVSALLCACGSAMMPNGFKNNGKIPGDWDFNKTLLIAKVPLADRVNNNMEDYLQKTYTKPYEMISLRDIVAETGKYADMSKYRYAVLYSSYNVVRTKVGEGEYSRMDLTAWQFRLYDRQTKQEYESSPGSGYAITDFKPFVRMLMYYINKKEQ